MILKGFVSKQIANPSMSRLCHCLISFCHVVLLQCSVIVFFSMFQLTGTFTNEILTKGEVKRFSPSRSEFRNLSFLITADDISVVQEQKGESICWQEEKKEYTQDTVYLQLFFFFFQTLETGDVGVKVAMLNVQVNVLLLLHDDEKLAFRMNLEMTH